MADRRNGGLSGKARRVHYKARYTKATADAWIEDYACGPVLGAPTARVIPVRHRSARLAILTVPRRETATSQSAQLKLPFDIDTSCADAKPPPLAQAAPDVAWKPTRPRQMPDDAQATKPLENRRSEPTRGVASSRERQEFTMRRFLLGCLMGGAAAAAVLFAFRMIAG